MGAPAEGQARRVERFRALHAAGCFVMPNPWDLGSARWLRGAGFEALATTSAGFAFTQARADQDVPRDMMLAHVADIVAAVPDLPVNADFENGYADDPEGVARNVRACVETGVAGLSIEDATGRADDPLYPFDLAVERVRAARRAIDASGSGVLLTARAEGVLVGDPGGIAEACRRLAAYAQAGADVLYAPGPRTTQDIAAVVATAGPLPVNVLVHGDFGLTVGDIAALGVRRISTGGALARAAWSAFIATVDGIREKGSFAGYADNARSAPLNPFFRRDREERGA